MVEVNVPGQVRKGIKAVVWLVAALFIIPVFGFIFSAVLPYVTLFPFGLALGMILFAVIYHIVENEFV